MDLSLQRAIILRISKFIIMNLANIPFPQWATFFLAQIAGFVDLFAILS